MITKKPLLFIFNILSLFTPIFIFITTLVTILQTLTILIIMPITTSITTSIIITKKQGKLKKNLIIINISVTLITSITLIF